MHVTSPQYELQLACGTDVRLVETEILRLIKYTAEAVYVHHAAGIYQMV